MYEEESEQETKRDVMELMAAIAAISPPRVPVAHT